MDVILISLLVLVHIILTSIFLSDLVSVSQRHNKFQWGIMLILVPLVSIFLYAKSKKRNNLHN